MCHMYFANNNKRVLIIPYMLRPHALTVPYYKAFMRRHIISILLAVLLGENIYVIWYAMFNF